MKKEKSAGAIIFRKEGGQKYYLLLNYKSGHWDLVKGHVENGESIRETITRETKEETSIEKIEFIPGFEEEIKYFFKDKYENNKRLDKKSLILKKVVFLLAKTEQKKVKISSEHIDSIWLRPEQAVEKLTFKNAKEILKKADKFLKSYYGGKK